MINPLSRINFAAIQARLTTYKNRVVETAQPLIHTLGQAVNVPLRWFGSKTFSIPGIIVRFPVVAIKHLLGKNDPAMTFKEELLPQKGYTWFTHKDLKPEDAKEYLLHATAAGCVHRNNVSWLEPFGYTPIPAERFTVDAVKDEYAIFDKETGIKIILFQKGDELLLVFGALRTHESQFKPQDLKESNKLTTKVKLSCLSSLLGGKPALYTRANELVSQIMQSDVVKGKKVTICGQSLGGSIASYVGLQQQIPAVALNGFPLGAGLQQLIGKEKLDNADQIVSNIRVKGDYWCDVPVIIKLFDIFVSGLGLKTPGNFGKLLDVPAIHTGAQNNHVDVYGALASWWKPECKPLCLDRFSADSQSRSESSKKLAKIVAEQFANSR